MLKLFISGIIWHYSEAYKELFRLSSNFISFLFHFFSIKDLSKTLFYPWQRLGEKYRGGFDISAWFSAFVVNALMRIVGFIARSGVIIIGFICIAISIVLAFLLFIVWTILPVFLVFLFITSFRLFFSILK